MPHNTLIAVPELNQACLSKPRDSLRSKGAATALPGLVHIAANECTPGGLQHARRGQVRDCEPGATGTVGLCEPGATGTVDLCEPDFSGQCPSWVLLGAISHFLKVSIMKTPKYLVPFLTAAASIVAAVPAFAVDPATALEAVTSLQGGAAGFAPIMFGLAITVVGIMIGVKWIKRAKGAA